MNKKIKLLVALILIAGAALYFNTVPLPSAMEQTISDQEIYSVQTISNILSFAKSKRGERIWPGFQLAEGPVVLWFDNGHVYALNLKGKNQGWKNIILPNGSQALYSAEDRWGATKVEMNPEFNIEGQKAYVFHLDLIKNHPFLPYFVFVHERFHPYQESAFTETPTGEYKDHLNSENLALMHIEGQLLLEFLQSSDPDEKLERLKDFIAVHKQRLSEMEQESILWEKHQQTIEGLADYVGLRMLERSGIMRTFAQMHLLITMQSHIDDPNITELSIKRRHYGVGATLGYALDYLHVKGWKKQVQSGKSLDDILLETLNESPEESTSRLASVKQSREYSEIKLDIQEATKEYSEDIAYLMNEYQAQEGLTMKIAKPKNPVSGGGMDMRMLYLSDGSILSVENQSVSSTSDRTWNMTLDVPYVFQDKEGAREFKVEYDLKVVIDDKPYLVKQLVDEKEIPFQTLSWEGQRGKFSAQCSGVLRMHEGKVCIDFDDKG
jgi:hypothetical protein